MAKPEQRREPSKKEQTRERILKSAGKALRQGGFDAVSVGKVMKDAGLTHGGFYAHFPSREALLEAALDRASADGLAVLESAACERQSGSALAGLVRQYLSDSHVQHPEAGCALAAVGSETRRQSKATRKIATARVEQMLSLIEASLGPPAETRRERALSTLSALVGALVVARAVSEPRLSRELREAVTRSLVGC